MSWSIYAPTGVDELEDRMRRAHGGDDDPDDVLADMRYEPGMLGYAAVHLDAIDDPMWGIDHAIAWSRDFSEPVFYIAYGDDPAMYRLEGGVQSDVDGVTDDVLRRQLGFAAETVGHAVEKFAPPFVVEGSSHGEIETAVLHILRVDRLPPAIRIGPGKDGVLVEPDGWRGLAIDLWEQLPAATIYAPLRDYDGNVWIDRYGPGDATATWGGPGVEVATNATRIDEIRGARTLREILEALGIDAKQVTG